MVDKSSLVIRNAHRDCIIYLSYLMELDKQKFSTLQFSLQNNCFRDQECDTGSAILSKELLVDDHIIRRYYMYCTCT